MEYRIAKEAGLIAEEIMSEHHPHLLGVDVVVLFVGKTPKSKGKEVWGRAKKVSGLPAVLATGIPEHYEDQPPDFFVVEIAEDIWRQMTMEASRRALVDHCLCQCEIETDEETGATKLAIAGPDVAEFDAVLERHGLWTSSVWGFVRAGAEQLSLANASG